MKCFRKKGKEGCVEGVVGVFVFFLLYDGNRKLRFWVGWEGGGR